MLTWRYDICWCHTIFYDYVAIYLIFFFLLSHQDHSFPSKPEFCISFELNVKLCISHWVSYCATLPAYQFILMLLNIIVACCNKQWQYLCLACRCSSNRVASWPPTLSDNQWRGMCTIQFPSLRGSELLAWEACDASAFYPSTCSPGFCLPPTPFIFASHFRIVILYVCHYEICKIFKLWTVFFSVTLHNLKSSLVQLYSNCDLIKVYRESKETA